MSSDKKRQDDFLEIEEMPLELDELFSDYEGEEIVSDSLQDQKNNESRIPLRDLTDIPENQIFVDLLGRNILLSLTSSKLNILGQKFRPIFCGTVVVVSDAFITLDPVTIKIHNAPFHRHPTPLSFPIEKIETFVPNFASDTVFPIP